MNVRAMRVLFGVVALLAVGVPAAAQEEEPEVPWIHIDIPNGLDIRGETVGPGGEIFQAREGAEFSPIFELRRSFLDRIIESAQEQGVL